MTNFKIMNVVETEALKFAESYFNNGEIISLTSLKERLSYKLSDFYKDREKLDFIKILRVDVVKQKEEHIKGCLNPSCDQEKEYDLALFVVDQELEEINQDYEFEALSKDKFTGAEESSTHHKLNEIIENLMELGRGQEIIFNELDDLKNHFNLGKKTFSQLLKGKLFDLHVQKILNETVVKEVWNDLADGINEFGNHFLGS